MKPISRSLLSPAMGSAAQALAFGLLLVTALLTGSVRAADDDVYGAAFSTGPYAGLTAGLLFVDAAKERFSPATVQLDFGYRFSPNLAAELSAGAGVMDDKSGNAEMSVDLAVGAHVFAGGTFNGRTGIALGLGYTHFELDTETGASGKPGSQDYQGPSFQLRLEERLRSLPSVIVRGGYQYVYLDGDVTISAAVLGAVYEF